MAKPTVLGVGFYEKGLFASRENGKKTRAYNAWKGILGRCYNPIVLAVRPSYKGCSVCEEWLNYQNFAQWFTENVPENHHIDKDLKHPTNKIYSPETCMILTPSENNFMLDRERDRGLLATGVTYRKTRSPYLAQISILSVRKRKSFSTEKEAYKWYVSEKIDSIPFITEDEVKSNLMRDWVSFKVQEMCIEKGWETNEIL